MNEYKIYAPCVNVVIDANGFIKSYALIYAVEIPIGNDQTIYTSIEASVEFKNLGEDVEITFPDGYWSFQEITTDILY